MQSEDQPTLDRPGAGIPFHLRILNQFLLKPLVIRKTSWIECEKNFTLSNEKFLMTLHDTHKIHRDFLFQKSLVPPQMGLEDSSRYWSMAMTAAHLMILGEKMQQVIVLLCNGMPIHEEVDIAAVKPSDQHNNDQSIANYKSFSKSALTFIQNGIKNETDKHSKNSHYHPWFGDMRPKDWLWLLGTHTQIHLKQIRKIKSQLLKAQS